MHNVLIISYIAFSIGNLFILPESDGPPGFFVRVAARYLREIFRAKPPPGAIFTVSFRSAGISIDSRL